MHRLLFLLSLPLLGQEAAPVNALHWLTGKWAGTIGRAKMEEQWLPPAGGAMVGVSRIIAGPRMVAFEYLRIVEKGGSLYYVAQPNGRPPTEFKLTSQEGQKLVFENPAHDHPKVITYTLLGEDELVATIEGDEGGKHKRQEFRFRKAKD